jgi:hypothetical protein
MLSAQSPWAGRDLYRATTTVTWDLGFSGLIRRTAPFSRLLQHTWGCGGPIRTRILTGLHCWVTYLNSKLRDQTPIDLKINRGHIFFEMYQGTIKQKLLVACVAQWLERRAQWSDDPCVRGSNPTVGHRCRSFGWDRINRGPLSQYVWHDKDPFLLKGPERRA